jgi:hypothetical protein
MNRRAELLKKPYGLLIAALVLIVLGSFLAGLFHTSFYGVKIQRIQFPTERGTLTGLLYMPKGAGPADPRPVIITTHGYLNSKEMQDAPAVEMSRRGYIVLALDMYDHGDSRWTQPIPPGGHFGTFWIYSQFDAAKYIYDQPFTKKDAAGNAYVAVSGHSMGGFSSFIAMYMDEMAALQNGYRMIYSGISVGSDFSFSQAVASQEQFQAAFGSRTVGMIAAHYDEFFFNKSEAEKTAEEKAITGTVVYKDFPATNSGKAFLGLDPSDPAGEAGRFYTVDSGPVTVNDLEVRPSQQGRRIIYTPSEIHPWNHFSRETTANLIEFYTTAFAGVTSPGQTKADLSPHNQIWWLKELFNFVALIGFLLLIPALVQLLLTLPFFKGAVAPVPEAISLGQSQGARVLAWVITFVVAWLPAIFFPQLFAKNAAGMRPLVWGAVIVGALSIIWLLYKASQKQEGQNVWAGCIAIAIFAVLLILWLAKPAWFLNLGAYFNQPTTNQIAYWAVASGLIAALVNVVVYYVNRKPTGTAFSSYGLLFKPMVIAASLATALAAVIIGYIVLWITQAIFKVDYRIWTLAVRTFRVEHFRTALRYLPFFFVFYLSNTVALNANTRGLGRCWSVAVAVILNAGGLALWLLYHYGKLFATGVAGYPAVTLDGILLFALTPFLGVAAVYARKVFEKTGHVWLAAFLNTLLFTMITAANTATFWNLLG